MAKYNNYIEVFDNLNSYINTINSRELNKVFKDAQREGSHTGSFSYCTTKTYEEANNLITTGDKSSLSKLRKVNIHDISSNETIQKLIVNRSVCGSLPNVPAYIMGVPNNMINFKKTYQKSKIINIAINAGVDWMTSAEDIIRAGAKIASIIKELELQKFRVNLYIGIFSVNRYRQNTQYIGSIVNVKKSSAPLNMLNIAYPLINPSFLRRHFFRFMETAPAEIMKQFADGGYGMVASWRSVLNNSKELKNKFKDYICIDLIDMLKKSSKDIAKEFINKR